MQTRGKNLRYKGNFSHWVFVPYSSGYNLASFFFFSNSPFVSFLPLHSGELIIGGDYGLRLPLRRGPPCI